MRPVNRDRFIVHVVQGKSGLWAAVCRSEAYPDIVGRAAERRSEGAAVRTATQNYIHARGLLSGDRTK